MTTLLITGTGAIIGYGALRSARGLPGVRCIAADMFGHAAGQHFAHAFEQAPMTASTDYGAWLNKIITRHKVDLLLPGIEQDVAWLARAVASGHAPSVALALNRPELIELSSDKIAFDLCLEDMGEPARIDAATQGDFVTLAKRLGLPFLLKPRRGYAGKGIIRVATLEDFAPHADLLGEVYLAQRIVGTEEDEYTVSAFCDAGRICAVIALRRHLSPEGATARAQTVDAAPFLQIMTRLCDAFKAEGPTNFQFRVAGGTPFLLEINPRISSATSLRTAFGYNEVAMCIDHFLLGRPVTQPDLRSGEAVRYIEDIVTYDDRTDL